MLAHIACFEQTKVSRPFPVHGSNSAQLADQKKRECRLIENRLIYRRVDASINMRALSESNTRQWSLG